MTDQNLPSVEYLRKRLRYEPETGKLYWLDHDGMPNWWRSKNSAREAFTANHNKGYRCGRVDKQKLLAHRVIWALAHGEWPDSQIDHINGDKIDNRLANLRDVSAAENRKNVSKQSNNTSGACGVCWYARDGKWQAQIKIGGKQRYLGRFATRDAAIAARLAASRELGFTDRHGT
jgi:hypothetical protein